MFVVYMSLTGNVRRFVQRLAFDSLELNQSNIDTKVDDNFVVIVPTYDHEITDLISDFINYEDNIDRLIGFAGSGNRNFDDDYVWSARELAAKFNKPLFLSFEFSGTDDDLANFKQEVIRLESTRAK